MNYGQTNPNPEQPFFTSGQGTNIESVNNVEAENNLDLTNNSTSWTNVPNRDPRNLGNSAISANLLGAISSPNNASPTPELAQVINIEMPPSYANQATIEPTNQPIAQDAGNQAVDINQSQIKTEEHLNSAGIAKVEETIKNLEQTGNTADFYERVRALMEENLEKSYNRKISS